MLNYNYIQRPSAADLLSHQFFSGIEWDEVHKNGYPCKPLLDVARIYHLKGDIYFQPHALQLRSFTSRTQEA